jgi:NAD(P)-dependent dehydrogenase (short-subunit alcohol dehydrogenase family)
VRDRTALQEAVDAGTAALGPVGVVVANAGISARSPREPDQTWLDIIDVNLTGVFHTLEVTWPAMVARGAGGSMILISSTGGLTGVGGTEPGRIAYTAAKHGVVALMRSYANFLAPHSIRVNSVHPTGVSTPMIENDFTRALRDSNPDAFPRNAPPVELIEPADVTGAGRVAGRRRGPLRDRGDSAGRRRLRESQVRPRAPPLGCIAGLTWRTVTATV